MRVDVHRFINLGFWWLHITHYAPKPYSEKHWGFMTSAWKRPTVDFYFGKHVFALELRRK